MKTGLSIARVLLYFVVYAYTVSSIRDGNVSIVVGFLGLLYSSLMNVYSGYMAYHLKIVSALSKELQIIKTSIDGNGQEGISFDNEKQAEKKALDIVMLSKVYPSMVGLFSLYIIIKNVLF